MDLLSPWSRESIKGQSCQTLRGKSVCTYVSMCVRACVHVWGCVLLTEFEVLWQVSDWVLSFPSSDNETYTHKHICSTHTHTHTQWKMEKEGEWGSCCFLKDAAPACMLKLALNVWITHGSSHRGFSSHSLETRGCVDVSIYIQTRAAWYWKKTDMAISFFCNIYVQEMSPDTRLHVYLSTDFTEIIIWVLW